MVFVPATMIFAFNVPKESNAQEVKAKTEEFLKTQFGIRSPKVEQLKSDEIYALNSS